MQNWHRHSSFSNLYTPDSAALNEEYAKRAIEIGHKTISSVEHGWQGYYFQTYELAKKYGLKPIIGAEAYWVKNRLTEYEHKDAQGKTTTTKDRSNHHILLLAKSNEGRESINDILSEANISGYYYKPRVDLPLLLSLPPKDVVVTTACIAFNGYEDIDNIILQLADHFGENFLLEVQYHNTEKQKKWNKHLLDLHNRHHIELSVGLDSHYILPEDAQLRDYLLEAKGMHYEDEEGWYMDYPDDDEVFRRFKEQGVLSDEDIQKAMDKTDISLDFCDYDKVRIFTKDIKLPSLYPNETQEQKNKRYEKLITKKFKEFMKNVPKERYDEYFQGVKNEVQTYIDCGMVDYPLIDYAIVQDAIKHGGLITKTGRGSAASFLTNTLCGFSQVDRFVSAIKLYPERFISTTRILETRSLPDIDCNVSDTSIFEESQKRILGDEHAAAMLAFGTLKKKSAFKLYAKANHMDFELANTITSQIDEYENAIKYADDDEADEINIYDYVDEQYREYIEGSEQYWGVISDKKKAPSAYLLYDGNIRREIGLMKCKSESTKKEYITCCMDGAVAENYKFLKNDLLKVDVVLLIAKVFERIGIEPFDVTTLIDYLKNDDEVWDIYANGYTIGVNQVEKEGSRHKCMRYKPHNLSELSAFVAAIRPGFRSMYLRFEAREDFSWGIPSLDNLIRTEELPVSFLFFQEQVMSILNFAGFPMDECYGIIKAIAKKHPEKVRPLKQKFINGFQKRLIDDENLSENEALINAQDVWTIVNDNCGYSFNSSHAYCMALDSAYQAWQKAHYPYEFYEVLLQHYSDKGNKDKVNELKTEMKKAFGIKEGEYKFRLDNRSFTADKEHKRINPSLVSIKGMSQKVADDLYSLKDNNYDTFVDVLVDLKNTSVSNGHIDKLIKIDYFSEFGDVFNLLNQLKWFNLLYQKKQFKYVKLEELGIGVDLAKQYASKMTEKQLNIDDSIAFLKAVVTSDVKPKISTLERMRLQHEILGYVNITCPNMDEDYYYITDVTGTSARMVTMYQLCTGDSWKIKVRKKQYDSNPIEKGQMIHVLEILNDKKWIKVGEDADGKPIFERSEARENILKNYNIVT